MSDIPVIISERFVMSDPMQPQQPRRELPQTTLQFAGHAAEHVVGGLSGRSPYMLGIVILNVLGIAAAVYFLNVLITGQQQHLKTLVDTLNNKQTELIVLHKQEFDMLLGMIPRYEAQTAPAVVPPTVNTQTAPVIPLPQGRRP